MNATAISSTPKPAAAEERDSKIIDAIRSGDSFTNIGKQYGISRERVRQIGLTFMEEHPDEDLMDKNREMRTRLAATARTRGHETALDRVKTLAEKFPNDTSASIARRAGSGVKPDEVADLLGAAEVARREGARFVRSENGEGKVYSDEECLEALRAVGRKVGKDGEYGVVTMEKYDQFAPKGAPKSITIQHRFGSWSGACTKAGVPFGEPTSNRVYETRWTPEERVEIVRDFFRQTGFVDSPMGRGSMRDYTEWAEEQEAKGRPVPKAATLRAYHGSWSAIKQIGLDMIAEREAAQK